MKMKITNVCGLFAEECRQVSAAEHHGRGSGQGCILCKASSWVTLAKAIEAELECRVIESPQVLKTALAVRMDENLCLCLNNEDCAVLQALLPRFIQSITDELGERGRARARNSQTAVSPCAKLHNMQS
jgi:hypothetical protein